MSTMKTLKIAVHLLWKRKLSNAILVLEIFLSVFMLAQMFVYITDYMDNIRAIDELPKNNTYIMNTFSYCNKEQILAAIQQDPAVDAVGRVFMGNTSCNQVASNLVVYPQSIIARYAPSLQSGEWLSTAAGSDSSVLPAVVSADIGLNVGEKADIYLPGKGLVSICVTGVLHTPTQYLFPSGGASASQFAVSSIISQYPVVILREVDYGDPSALIRSSDIGLPENFFVFFKNTVSQATIDVFRSTYGMYGEINSMDLLISNYHVQASTMIDSGIVFFLVFLLVAVTSILSNSVVEKMSNQRLFTIYYMLGMDWKKSIVVEALRILVLAFMVTCVSFIAGQSGWLMLEWMTAERVWLFYGIAITYTFLLLIVVSGVFLVKMVQTDISISLKSLHQGE